MPSALFGYLCADESRADAIDVGTETIDDYLQDFRCWLPSYLYASGPGGLTGWSGPTGIA